MFFARLTKL